MSATYLVQRGRRFHLRLRIPSDLFRFFGRSELHRSLRINDRQTARIMARTLQGRAEVAFATIRHRQSLGDALRGCLNWRGRFTPRTFRRRAGRSFGETPMAQPSRPTHLRSSPKRSPLT